MEFPRAAYWAISFSFGIFYLCSHWCRSYPGEATGMRDLWHLLQGFAYRRCLIDVKFEFESHGPSVCELSPKMFLDFLRPGGGYQVHQDECNCQKFSLPPTCRPRRRELRSIYSAVACTQSLSALETGRSGMVMPWTAHVLPSSSWQTTLGKGKCHYLR